MTTLQQLTNYLNNRPNLFNVESVLSNYTTVKFLLTPALDIFKLFVRYNSQNSDEVIDALTLSRQIANLTASLELETNPDYWNPAIETLEEQCITRVLNGLNTFRVNWPVMPEDIKEVLVETIGIESENQILSAFGDDCNDIDISHFNPKFSPKSGTRFYGLEVEFNNATSLREIQEVIENNRLGKVIKDGSCGYEMVSAPWEYDDMVNYIEKLPLNEVGVDDRCGIHIHVSRDIFTPLMLGRLMVFINDPDNKDYITKKVGRTANRYCQVSNKGKDPNQVKLESTTRYEAINLTNYSEGKFTIEFRMFASTAKKQVIKDYLKWLDTMITLSENHNLTIDLIESAINS